MSVVQFPEAIDTDIHVWNNAAFDDGEIGKDLTASRQSWGSLKSIFSNPKGSFDSVSDKENQCLSMDNNQMVSSSMKSTATPFKPVNTDDRAIERSRIAKKEIRDGKKIDEEIEEIESEIFRLKSRLEALRIEKAERSVKAAEKRGGRVVSAKFMDQKQSGVKNAGDRKINEEVSSVSGKSKIQRRGISLGPVEILSAQRRGMSMGPAEIFAKSRQLGKQEMVTPLQSRRKSCFYKLQEIDEESVVERERGKVSSLSPKSRKVAAKNPALPRQAVTTISSRKNLKKEDSVINSIQPKKLFREGENIGTNKKPLRPGRVVASRYNQNNSQSQSAMRKRSFPENETDNRFDKKRSLSVGKSVVNVNEEKNLGTESRVKKRWEIPSEIIVHGSGGGVERERMMPHSVVVVNDLLPRIRVSRCVNESPRDSGPAKKVVELIGRKSFFADGDDVAPSVCQALSYAEEDDDEGEQY